ncbi:YqgE/AlgH family protein [Brachymonas sp. M4Q-1]|uniref:YqgE/AlgH family protein n=1 Tax=Brachymonas sp. M4Q-1 TaxID=3416906 RepID=UPI003CF435E7
MPSDPAPDFNLSQHFLIAMPGMEDELFARSVIYICEHTPRGVLGLCINKLADLSMHDLFRQAKLPMNRSDLEDEPIFWGGPVQSERGFILHPQAEDATAGLPVYASSLVTGDGLQMTTSRDILQALAEGHGPEKLLVALGYAAWESGQLEDELRRNSWLTVRADHHLIFEVPVAERYDAAMALLGVEAWRLAGTAGSA